MKTMPIPTMEAFDIARRFGYHQVIIIARKMDANGDNCSEHVTATGIDENHRAAAARIGNFIKRGIMHWAEEAESSERLKKLQTDHDELVSLAREILLSDEGALLQLRHLGIKAPVESHEFPTRLRALLTKLGVAL